MYTPQEKKHIQGIILQVVRESGSVNNARKKANIGNTTLYEWLKDEKFKAQVNEAKDEYRNSLQGKLESALYKRAVGYDFTETETEYISDENGEPKIKSQKTRVKHIAPDVAALIFALTNIAPEKWINKQRVEQKQAATKEEERFDYDFEGVSEDLLKQVADAIQENEHKKLMAKKTQKKEN